MDRTTIKNAESAVPVPAWHVDGCGTPDLGEFASDTREVAATAGGPIAVTVFPSVSSFLRAQAGDDEPQVMLEVENGDVQTVEIALRLREAEEVAGHLLELVAAARASRRAM